MAKGKIPPDLQAWIDARKRHRLSHAQVQMARELARRRFKRDAPAHVVSIEEGAGAAAAKQEARRREKAARREAKASAPDLAPDSGEEAP